MSWQAIAERAAEARCTKILDRVAAAVAEQAPRARIERTSHSIRVRDHGIQVRWISNSALRFARRIER